MTGAELPWPFCMFFLSPAKFFAADLIFLGRQDIFTNCISFYGLAVLGSDGPTDGRVSTRI